MNQQFTLKLKKWLNAPTNERDYKQGALFVLQLTNNRILYNNLMRNIKANKDVIEYQIQKHYNFRVQDLTAQQVKSMQKKVNTIVKDHVEPENKRLGKRNDHDALPTDVQALYLENFSILQKMRELHLQLRNLSLDNHPCPDSERYPFLKELIALDKKLHANWNKYDAYGKD